MREAYAVTVRSGQSGRRSAGSGLHWSAGEDAALEEALSRVRDGITTLLLVEGAPGMGKSAYLRRAVDAAHGFHILTIQVDSETQPRYGALVELGVLDTVPDPSLTALQAAKMLRSCIDRTRNGAPVLLVVDDLENLDPGSSDMLTRLLEGTFGDRLLVAAAARSLLEDQLAPWERLSVDPDLAVTVKLTGLGERDVAEIVAAQWPAAEDTLKTRLWRHTAGNPLFLRAILREYSCDAIRDAEELPAPQALVRAFVDRLARLGDSPAALMRAVVVLGDRWTSLRTAGELAQVADPASAAELLEADGLLAIRGTQDQREVRVERGVVRTALIGAIPVDLLHDLHRRAADLVSSPDEALRHRFLASQGPDEPLAQDLENRAWSLHLDRQFRQACRVGLWASIASEDPADRERRLFDALFDAALARDLDTVDRELDRLDGARDEARRRLIEGFALVVRRRWGPAASVLRTIPSQALASTDERTRFRVHVLLAWSGVVTGAEDADVRHQLELANSAGLVDPCLSGYVGFASALANDASVSETPAQVTDGIDLDDAWRGAAAAVDGLPDVAVRHLRPFVDQIDDGIVTMGDGEFHALLGYAYWLRGEWSKARTLIRTSLDARYSAAHPMVRAVSVLADLSVGDSEALTRHRGETRTALRDAPWPPAISMAATAEFLCLRLTGQTGPQGRYLDALNADLGPITWHSTPPSLWLLSFGMINAAAGRLDGVRECADRLRSIRHPTDWGEAGVAWLRGLAAECAGDYGEAELFLTSARTKGMGGLRIHGALLFDDLARIQQGLGDTTGSAASRREFESRLAAVDGASHLIGATADPLAPLSQRERDVVMLLSQGLSYAQIAQELYLSRSTVAFHLSNVYAKTATRSRHELIELVRRN